MPSHVSANPFGLSGKTLSQSSRSHHRFVGFLAPCPLAGRPTPGGRLWILIHGVLPLHPLCSTQSLHSTPSFFPLVSSAARATGCGTTMFAKRSNRVGCTPARRQRRAHWSPALLPASRAFLLREEWQLPRNPQVPALPGEAMDPNPRHTRPPPPLLFNSG
jgi:hypothetical protein